MTKITKFQTLGIQIRGFDLFGFVWLRVCFGFGASNFGFAFLRFVSNFDIRISNLLA